MALNTQPTYYNEPFRPQFHFSPEAGWMNDPNGLVCFQGEYHLFYQHYPFGTNWSTMHWGHAVSDDLLHWTHLPIALYPDVNGPIFSGSVVVDAQNTSGLVPGGGLIAVFSYENQNQGIAYSHDRGRTWTMYAGNPVLRNPGPTQDFRDPRVFWYEPAQKWVMILAANDRVEIYDSRDLTTWAPAGEFGAHQGAHNGVWECPDLFPLDADGQTKWVLLVSITTGAPAGGSGTQYFVGDFDGTTFTTENPDSTVLWLDQGPDNYAAVTWNQTPDNRRILLGWMNNWLYAGTLPTSTWRGAMTIPRRLALRTLAGHGTRLIQSPILELQSLREPSAHRESQTIHPGSHLLEGVTGWTLEIAADFALGAAVEIGFGLFQDDYQFALVGYNRASSSIHVDRLHRFHPDFAGLFDAPLPNAGDRIKLHLFIDWSSIEVFANEGESAITSQIFPPSGGAPRMELYCVGGQARLISMDLFALRRTWPIKSTSLG